MTISNQSENATGGDVWQKRAARERAAREAAESILEQKSTELFELNEALNDAKSALEQQLYEIENERDRVLLASRTDHLTSVANRSAFLADLGTLFHSERGGGEQLWLFVFDIRRFKQINASFGQQTGDMVLVEISRRLKELANLHGGRVARFAGTEFALLAELEEHAIETFVELVWHRIHEPVRVGSWNIPLQIAVGVSGTRLDFKSVEALHDAADFALTESRKTNRSVLFDEAHQKQIAHNRELEKMLRRAIDLYKIEPWFQPVVHVQDGNALSLEVLARWPEDRGFIPPADFIPIAEEIGLRRQLDHWVIRSAFLQAKAWVQTGQIRDISVNVPPSDLMSTQFVKDLDNLLNETKYPRDCLVLEVTESVFIEDLSFVNSQLERLSKLGVQIALDDFGTGYSNLRSLVGLPLSKIKLDKSLIQDMGTNHKVAMLVSTFIQWARASDLHIVAEGVETETQAVLLKALGCTSLQGFLYGKAMSSRDVERTLLKRADLRQAAS